MIEAYISGRLGKGVFAENGAFFVEGPETPRRLATAREIAHLTNAGSSFRVEHLSKIADLSAAVRSATDDANAQFLVLSSINPHLSITTRLTCAQAVESLLSTTRCKCLLEILLSTPLPAEARIDSAAALSYFASFNNLAHLLRTLFESQDAIATIDGAITSSISMAHLTNGEGDEVRAEFVQAKLYGAITQAFKTSNLNDFNTAVVTSLLHLKQFSTSGLAAEILTQIQRSISKLFRSPLPKQQSLKLQAAEDGKWEAQRRTGSIYDLLSNDPLASLSRLSSFEAKTNVDRQIAGIKKQILNGKDDLVEKYLEELVRFQLGNSEKEQLAKSLSLLTSVALAANQLTIADRLSLYALQLKVEDQVVYTTRAEVLKYLGQFDASLQAYRDAKLRFPESAYAWNGEADVLKEAGRYEEALAAYSKVKARFSEDPVPYNGFVATLRRMGRTREGIAQAWRNVKAFHDDNVTRTELANVLSAAGRYNDAALHYKLVLDRDPKAVRALLAYTRVLNYLGERDRALRELERKSQFRQDPVIQNALAQQYRIMGKYELAATTARKVKDAFPGYNPARYSLATALLLAGDTAAAIAELPGQHARSENDWYGYRTYLICMLSGDRKQSILQLEQAERDCVWPYQRSRIATVLAVAYARGNRRSEAFKILEGGTKLPEAHHRQTRLVLLGALNAQSGRTQIARTILNQVLVTRDPSINKLKALILTRTLQPQSFLPVLLAA